MDISHLQSMYGAERVRILTSDTNIQPEQNSQKAPATQSTPKEFINSDSPLFKSPEQRAAEFEQQELAKIAMMEERAKTLPPRPEGALGEDLRLKMEDLDKANFLEDMKIKYARLKDTKQANGSGIHGALFTLTDEERLDYETVSKLMYEVSNEALNERTGNGFVMQSYVGYDNILSKIGRLESHAERIQHFQNNLEDPFAKGSLVEHEKMFAKTYQEITTILQHNIKWADEHNARAEDVAYFADYTKFEHGKSMNLEDIYKEFNII